VLSTALSVLLIFNSDRWESNIIGDLVILNGILWGATTILIVTPMIGVRPPAPPGPGPVPETDDKSSDGDD
jgi:hypothetical protein